MSTESEMMFSVVLPTYRVAQFVERVIISLQIQSFKAFEMIFVDDCGNDGSIDIVARYAERDPRIRIVTHEHNRGTYHARKTGVEHARGRYIIFLDPDDELDEHCLNQLYEHLHGSPASVIFYGVTFTPPLQWYKSPTRSYPLRSKDRLLESMFKKSIGGYTFTTLGTPGKAYDRKLLLSVYEELAIPDDFRYVYSEDSVVLLTSAMNNPGFRTIDYRGYIYHLNPSSITHKEQMSSRSRFISEQLTYTVDILREQIGRHHLTKAEEEFFRFYIHRHTKSELSLFARFDSSGAHYFTSVASAFFARPRLKHVAMMVFFVVTLGRKRL